MHCEDCDYYGSDKCPAHVSLLEELKKSRDDKKKKCPGKCYCGKDCIVNHEKVAERCHCDGIHNMCRGTCEKHNKACVCIARHKGNCDCLQCFLGDGAVDHLKKLGKF